MLPDVELTPQAGGLPVSLRPARGETTVIVWRHRFPCRVCDGYIQGVAILENEFRIWEARLLILAPSPLSPIPGASFCTHAVDVQLPPQGAGVIVADRYGQVFYAVRTDASHQFPPTRELTEWLKYLGTLCPE